MATEVTSTSGQSNCVAVHSTDYCFLGFCGKAIHSRNFKRLPDTILGKQIPFASRKNIEQKRYRKV